MYIHSKNVCAVLATAMAFHLASVYLPKLLHNYTDGRRKSIKKRSNNPEPSHPCENNSDSIHTSHLLAQTTQLKAQVESYKSFIDEHFEGGGKEESVKEPLARLEQYISNLEASNRALQASLDRANMGLDIQKVTETGLRMELGQLKSENEMKTVQVQSLQVQVDQLEQDKISQERRMSTLEEDMVHLRRV
jgi:chromosome segregation ATPase